MLFVYSVNSCKYVHLFAWYNRSLFPFLADFFDVSSLLSCVLVLADLMVALLLLL